MMLKSLSQAPGELYIPLISYKLCLIFLTQENTSTPLISPRTKAIQEFINEHKITSYIILDDFDMANVFDYHFIYVHNYFKEPDYKKADYALFIQQKENKH